MDRDYIRRLVWESLLNADFSSRYFGHLAGLLQTRERIITVVVGVLSSGAFLALISKFQLGYLPQLLSALTAVFSITLATRKLGKSAALSASLHSRWTAIQNDYEILWSEAEFLSSEQIAERWRNIENSHMKDDETAAQEFRIDKKLADECQKAVLQMRHLVEVK